MEKGYKIYMVGAAEDVIVDAVANLQQQYPKAQSVGSHHGYFNMEDPPAELIDDIREKAPDIMLIGMATPYKEKFVVFNKEKMGVPVSLGVGGMFDIAAGRAHFAPDWIRKLALEWLYRLAQEPRRMWRRYLTTNSIFLWLFSIELVKKIFGLRRD